MTDITFNARVVGLFGVNSQVRAVERGVRRAFSSGRLETFLLESTRARFRPKGFHPNAQMSPEGHPWRKLAPSTLRRRKKSRDPNRKLYDTGELSRAISVIRDGVKTRPNAIGAFEIGVSPASKAFRYYKLQDEGGINDEGHKVPKRSFLGISKRDLEQLGVILKKAIEKEL